MIHDAPLVDSFLAHVLAQGAPFANQGEGGFFHHIDIAMDIHLVRIHQRVIPSLDEYEIAIESVESMYHLLHNLHGGWKVFRATCDRNTFYFAAPTEEWLVDRLAQSFSKYKEEIGERPSLQNSAQ